MIGDPEEYSCTEFRLSRDQHFGKWYTLTPAPNVIPAATGQPFESNYMGLKCNIGLEDGHRDGPQ